MTSIDQNIALKSTLSALRTDRELLDGRAEIDHLHFLSQFASVLNLYDGNNKLIGDWSAMLLKDPVFLTATIAKTDLENLLNRYNNACLSLERAITGKLIEHNPNAKNTRLTDKDHRKTIIKSSYEELLKVTFDVFSMLVFWTNFMQRYPKEYILKKFVLQQVTDTYGPLLWATLQLREELYISKKLDRPKVERPYTFESTEQYCWLVNKGKKPFWDILNDLNPEDNSSITLGNLPSKNDHFQLYEALKNAGKSVLSFLKQITDYSNEEFKEIRKQTTFYPDTALLRTFVNLLDGYKVKLNKIAEDHLNFYYQDVLKQNTLGYQADKVFACLTSSIQDNYTLPAATAFLAGGYEDGSPTYFKTVKDTALNAAKLGKAFTLCKKSSNNMESLFLTEKEGVDSVGKTPDGQVNSWALFGSEEGAEQVFAFVLASPLLLLKEGERKITLDLVFTEKVQSAFLDQLTFSLSTEKGWWDVIFDRVDKPNASTDLDETNQLKGSKEELNHEKGVKNVSLMAKLTSQEPAIVPMPEGTEISSDWAMLQISFMSVAHFSIPPAFDSIKIEVSAYGMSNFTIENDYGTLEPAKPFQPLGPTPKQANCFYIGNTEIFSKPFTCLNLTFDWGKLPANFYDYYLTYSAYLIWNAFQKEGKISRNADQLLFFNNVFKACFSLGQENASWSDISLNNIRWNDQSTLQCLFTEDHAQPKSTAPVSCEDIDRINEPSNDSKHTVTYKLWDNYIKDLEDLKHDQSIFKEIVAQADAISKTSNDLIPIFEEAANPDLIKGIDQVHVWEKELSKYIQDENRNYIEIDTQLDEFESGLKSLIGTINQDIKTRKDLNTFSDLSTLSEHLDAITLILKNNLNGVINSDTDKKVQSLVALIQDLVQKAKLNEEWVTLQTLYKGLLKVNRLIDELEKVFEKDLKDLKGQHFFKKIEIILGLLFGLRDELGLELDLIKLKNELENEVFIKALESSFASLRKVLGALEVVEPPADDLLQHLNEDSEALKYFYTIYQALASLQKENSQLFHGLAEQSIFNYQWIVKNKKDKENPCISSDTSPFAYDPSIQLEALQLDENNTKGFLKLELAEPDHGFANDIYAQVVTTVALYNGAQMIIGGTKGPKNIMDAPVAPFVPIMKGLSASYNACFKYDFSTSSEKLSGSYPIECFYGTPFGTYKVFDSTLTNDFKSLRSTGGDSVSSNDAKQGLPLCPAFTDKGALFLSFTDPTPETEINLFAELSSKATNGKITTENLNYYYLAQEGWKTLDINSDSTRSFICSGILNFEFPADASFSNSLMPSNSYWLYIGVDKNVKQYPSVLYLNTNGILLQRDLNDTPSDFSPELKANAITKPKEALPEVVSVSQPFPSFGGKSKESKVQRNIRVSNRLKQRGRASTYGDYYRLTLQHFPDIFFCKTLVEKSNRSITVYCALKITSKNQVNSFLPLVSDCRLLEIENFLSQKSSPLDTILVENFEPSFIRLKCTVRSLDSGPQQPLNQAIDQAFKLYLSPWITSVSQCVSIDTDISTVELSKVIMDIPGVAGIESIQLYQLTTDEKKQTLEGPSQRIAPKGKNLLVPSIHNEIKIA